MKIKTLIPLISTATGIFWIYYGLSRHGFWHPVKGPQAGFVPTLIAVTLVGISIPGVIQSLKQKDEPDRMENWTIVLASAAIFFSVLLFGMTISLLAFVFVWLKIYEKASWKDTIIVLVISFAIIFGIFVLWLGVPFPRGIIIDTI